MTGKLKLVNGKLVKVDEEPKQQTPKVETPKPVEEPQPVQTRPQPQVVERYVPEEMEDEGFPDDVLDEEDNQDAQEEYDEEDDVQENEYDDIPEGPQQPTRGVLILNIKDSEPLQMVVPIQAIDETIERVQKAIETDSTIVVENVIINARYIITFSVLVQ